LRGGDCLGRQFGIDVAAAVVDGADVQRARRPRKVHSQGPTEADVTEGSRGIWERLRYDWSNPDRVVMKTTDSNTWGGNSGHTYTFTRNTDGTTGIDVVIVRDPKSVKGHALGVVLSTVGRGALPKAFASTVKAIEARNAKAPQPAQG
jgi:hypothetical protein